MAGLVGSADPRLSQQHTPLQGAATVAVVTEKRPIVITSAQLADASPQQRRILEELGLRQMLQVPIVHEDQVVGLLIVSYATKKGLLPPMLDLAQTVANHVAAAIVHAQLYDQSVRRARELEALHRISTAMVSNPEVPAMLEEIAEAALSAFDADRISIW